VTELGEFPNQILEIIFFQNWSGSAMDADQPPMPASEINRRCFLRSQLLAIVSQWPANGRGAPYSK